MVLANVEWIGTLCTALSLTCTGQLVITGFLTFAFSDFLTLTNTDLATCAGLISGFVALPTAIRLKAAKISPNMDRIYGYTLCYQRLAIGISGLLHLSAALLAIYPFFTESYLGHDFHNLIITYHNKQFSKNLVDNVQFIFQCCGGYYYKEWYKIDWGGYQINTQRRRRFRKKSFAELLREDTDAYPDLSSVRRDTVPFSCCARAAAAGCVHQNLVQLKTDTINTCGCVPKLHEISHTLLWSEFAVYGLCFLLEVSVFIFLRRPGSNEDEGGSPSDVPVNHNKPTKLKKDRQSWSSFSNNSSSNQAEIKPSSHSQVTFKKQANKE